MSLARRRRAVASAEARAAARISEARTTLAALRDDDRSPLYPLAVVGAGLAAGFAAGRVGQRAATPAPAPAVPGRPLAGVTGLAATLRLLQSLVPLWQSLKANDGTAATRPSPQGSAERNHAPGD